MALEEEHANELVQKDADEVDTDSFSDMITNIKIGLMGPLAGIGDSIDMGTVRPIILSLFIPLAAAGSMLGGIGAVGTIWNLYDSVGIFPCNKRTFSWT